jgi:hypothetical protein
LVLRTSLSGSKNGDSIEYLGKGIERFRRTPTQSVFDGAAVAITHCNPID